MFISGAPHLRRGPGADSRFLGARPSQLRRLRMLGFWRHLFDRRQKARPASMSDGYDAVDIADLVVRKTEAFRARRIDDVIPAEALQPTLSAVPPAGHLVPASSHPAG